MADVLLQHAEANSNALALVAPTQRWTYESLFADSAGVQEALEAQGVEYGSRVGLHALQDADAVRLLWALWGMGAVGVPLSSRLPAADVIRRARRVDVSVLFTTDADVSRKAPSGVSVRSPGAVLNGDGSGGPVPSRSARRAATILFTSGSTGSPKAVLHTWANHLYSAKGANANIPLRCGDRWLLSLPLYHVGGLAVLIRCALVGATVVIPSQDRPLRDALEETKATHASLVPTQFRRLLQADGGIAPAALRAVLLGGGPIPESLVRRGRARGWPLHTSYGCTEMASQVTTTAPGAPEDDLVTAGRRLPHRQIRVRDGEILVAGQPLFQGYVTEHGIVEARTDDGWYATGDRGRLDASGRLHVQGRIDRMFVSGGENIHPEEIEAALQRLTDVERAVVVPVPDPAYGHRPVAFIRCRDEWSENGLERVLSEALPGFKIPDAFHSLPAEEEEGRLKVDRARLQERARKLQTNRDPEDTSDPLS